MKVYITRAWDTSEWDAEYLVVGVFSTKEKAIEAGEHYIDVADQYGSYKFNVDGIVIDEYYNEHLSGLAKVLK